MNGKILKISNNDLYGNVDDRKVSVYAMFNHLKYISCHPELVSGSGL